MVPAGAVPGGLSGRAGRGPGFPAPAGREPGPRSQPSFRLTLLFFLRRSGQAGHDSEDQRKYRRPRQAGFRGRAGGVRPGDRRASRAAAAAALYASGEEVLHLWGGRSTATGRPFTGQLAGDDRVRHQGRDQPVRDDAGRTGRTRRRRAGRRRTGRSSPRPARASIPVRWLLTHQAGLPVFDPAGAGHRGRPARLGQDHRAARGAGAAVGAGHADRVPRGDLRLPGR